MSRAEALFLCLGVSEALTDVQKQIATQNPAIGEWLKKFDPKELMMECAEKALHVLKERTPSITSIHKKEDKKWVIEMGLSFLESPVSISLHGGAIVFDGGCDAFEDKWSRFKKISIQFENAFLAEVTKSILQIMGYETNTKVVGDGGQWRFHIKGVAV